MSKRNWRIKAAKAAPAAAAKPGEFRAAGGMALIAEAASDAAGKPKLRTFSGNAYTGAPMKPEGYAVPIICDLDGFVVPGNQRPVLRQHDHEQIVGHTGIKVSAAGVELVDGVFSGEPEHTNKVTVPADNGLKWQLSIGANPVETSFIEAGEEAEVNGRTVTGPMIRSHKTELGEVSFVPLGADGDTSATVNASKGGKPVNFRNALKAAMKLMKAAKYNDDEIDKMDEEKAKAALKECMAADTPPADDKDAKAKAAKADDAPPDDEKEKTAAKAAAAARIQASRKADADEVRRVDGIKAAAKSYGVSTVKVDGKDVPLVATAIEGGWEVKDVELAALKAARPTSGGPHVYSTTNPEVSEAVLECAVFQATNCELFDDDFYSKDRGERGAMRARDAQRIKADLKRRYPEQVQDAAHKIFKGRIGLQQLLTSIAAAGGYRGSEVIRSDSDLGEVAAACMRIHADGASTISVGNVTANVQNKFLLQGYLYTEQAWSEIAARRAVKDFKATKSINLFGDVEFKDLGTNSELDSATLQDQAFANQVATSGRLITIPRSTIINDDLGAFGQVPMIMGRGAGLKLNKVFWSKFLNPGFDDGGTTNFFAATHTLLSGMVGASNLSSGAGSALGDPGLTAATLLFDRQTDPMGYPLGVDAEILLYPPELQSDALRLMNSEFIIMSALGSTSAAAKQPSNNIWKGRYKPVKSRYLSNSAYTGYSTLAWYLLANPSVLPVIEMAFLNGQEMPTVQTAGPDFQFNVLGITSRAFFDIGCNVQNFRGGVKSAGS